MTAGTEIFIHSFGAMGRIIIMTVDAHLHVESFGDVTLAVSGYFSNRASIDNSLDHDFSMARAAGFSNISFMDGGCGIIMAKDMMFSVAVKAERQFFSRRRSGKGQMDVFLVFLRLFWMTACTIHIDEALSEVDIGIGMGMAVYTEHFAFMVDVLAPFLRVNEDGANFSVTRNLCNVRFAMAEEAILV